MAQPDRAADPPAAAGHVAARHPGRRLAGRLRIAGRAWRVWLAAIVLLGAAARFWKPGWDGGAYHFHPDEWALNQAVRGLGPDLNPHFFFYGSLPIYLYRLAAEAAGWLTGEDWLSPPRLQLVGRTFSALASTVMLIPVFGVGKRLWGAGAGLLAAACCAGAALAIQAAHFGTADSAVALAAVALLWTSLRIADTGAQPWYLLSGVILGLAMATKLTAASFALLPLLGHLCAARQGRPAWASGGSPRSSLLPLLILAGSAAVVMLLGAPYYLLAWRELLLAVEEQTAELSGDSSLPYVWQFAGSTPYLFEVRNLVLWGLGLPLGLAAMAGWTWALARALYKPAAPLVILVLWPTLYLLYIGTWEARFVRHTLPLVPFCCLFAAGGVVALTRQMGRSWPRRSGPGYLLVAMLVAGAAGWGMALLAIYTAPDTRLAATAWIGENVPSGSRLIVEDNNDLVPVPGAVGQPSGYTFGVLQVTAPDTPAKMADFAAALAEGDLLVVPNRRWSAVLPRMSAFPLTARYYDLLFSGRLGYSAAATFSSPPRLGPFSWPDDGAEETFQVFDHPTVRLFRNSDRLSPATLHDLLGAGP